MYTSLYYFTTQYKHFHGFVEFMNGEWGNLFSCVFSLIPRIRLKALPEWGVMKCE